MNSINRNIGATKDTFDISWIQKEGKCWVYQPLEEEGDIYIRGVVKGIIPLSINKANSKISGMLETGSPFQARAHQIQKCRQSNTVERDLIEMDIINAPEVLRQLKRRLSQRKIHTLIWNSLIIVNPYKLISECYGDKVLNTYYDHVFVRKEEMKKHEPHIYSFMMNILSDQDSRKTQVVSISGQSGSGKTETNKEALKAISFCSSKMQRGKITANAPEARILQCDPILETFGNAKTIKNDNSSRFGKLVTLIMDESTLKIDKCLLKNYFLEKSRIISQSLNERNFHIFYQLLAFLSDKQKISLKLQQNGKAMRFDDFRYLTNRTTATVPDDKKMWDELNAAFRKLQFSQSVVREVWSVVAAILLLGNLQFQSTGEDQPCQIRNIQVSNSIAFLLGLDPKDFVDSLIYHRRVIGGDVINSAQSAKKCAQGRDSVAKTMYESLFSWLVSQLNLRLNRSQQELPDPKIVKLLDIYGFEVFDHNSFEQLCVNYTNEKIHQIYLQQIFVHEKSTFKKQGLEHVIKDLKFTDNIKIIDLLESNPRSVFNLLDQSCTLNVKDEDFLTNIKKHHDGNPQFPDHNKVNTRKSFIIRHTPGDIQYTIQGFRQKNKDWVRQDLMMRLSAIKITFIGKAFKEKYDTIKSESNKRFLSIKITKQVKQLITQMSTNTDMHFIRCIKPNEKKEAFLFVDRVCYNQIKYLGILDTIQLRKDTYHVRSPYEKFYSKYGILENNIKLLIDVNDGKVSGHDCKDITMRFVNDLNVQYNLDYQFGKERIFLKMSAQNRLDVLRQAKLEMIKYASTRIKAQFRFYKMSQKRKVYRRDLPRIQRAVRSYLIQLRVFRKKKAVRKIQNAWIKYHLQFYARKKYPIIRIFQSYFKKRKQQLVMSEKTKVVRRAKELLKQIAQTNIQCKKINSYYMMKDMLTEEIYEDFWGRLQYHYIDNMQKYFRGGADILQNIRSVKKAEDAAYYRLNIKYRRTMEIYLRGFIWKVNFNEKLKATIKIQSIFRMLKLRKKYIELKTQTLKIQRNWRKYFYDKEFNKAYTESYFSQQPVSTVRNEVNVWKSQLHRNLDGSKTNLGTVEKMLSGNQRLKMDKMGLFYYLLDFQVFCDLSHIYPDGSWIDNYLTLFDQSWQKGNPIQVVDVSDTRTIASTLNKAYTWGDVHFEDFDPQKPSFQSWKNINSVSLPQGKISKVKSHEKFAVVEMEGDQPVVIGDKRMFEEDFSSKQWKTLYQSFIIINGIVLTIKKIQFSRVPIHEKVVQLSCGYSHCIAKTSLRKVYTWGDNSHGQLGQGHFRRMAKPKLLQYFNKYAISVQQVQASAYGCIILDASSRMYWWGSNGTIKKLSHPKQIYIFEKSSFLTTPQKYTVIRIVPSWSKTISLIGITIAAHEGIFKSSQNQIKRKTFQNLISKWNEDVRSVMPPYIQTISGYFQEKLMPKPRLETNKSGREIEHQKIKERLLTQLILMEEAERTLLKERKKL